MIAMANSEASRLVLRKDVAELKRLAGWIEGFTQERTSPDVSFAVQLCLEEAVANIIMYGGADASVIAARMKTCEAALRIFVQFLLGGNIHRTGPAHRHRPSTRPSVLTSFEPSARDKCPRMNQSLIQRFGVRGLASLYVALLVSPPIAS